MELYLSETEKILFDLLSDGQPHRVQELLDALPNDMTERNVLHNHISNLRRKLLRANEDVIAQSFGKYVGYRRIKVLTPDNSQIIVSRKFKRSPFAYDGT